MCILSTLAYVKSPDIIQCPWTQGHGAHQSYHSGHLEESSNNVKEINMEKIMIQATSNMETEKVLGSDQVPVCHFLLKEK